MRIRTASGVILDMEKLPDNYVPVNCGECCARIGWMYEPLCDGFYGLCDECAARVSQGDMEDPFQMNEE